MRSLGVVSNYLAGPSLGAVKLEGEPLTDPVGASIQRATPGYRGQLLDVFSLTIRARVTSMLPLSLPRLAAVTLLSAALPLVWIVGAHLHLCFDGLEAPVTLHQLADGGAHLDHHSPEQEHSDSDVELDASLRRASKNGADAASIAPNTVQASPGVQSTSFLHAMNAPSCVRTAPRFLQPPLRAPPA